jgi:thiamine transport system ATP-binding protein
MLELKDLRLSVGAFDLRADWALPVGARLAVIGPSGAGKSTLLLALAGLVQGQGRMVWQGRDFGAMPASARPLSILFQEHNLFPHLTAFDNVALGVSPRLRLTVDQKAQVSQAIAQVGLVGKAALKPAALSGGQASRVALARLLLRRKPLALLDEPFAALGPGLRGQMLDLVQNLADQRGLTLLMVTHAIEDARRIATHICFVDQGRAAPPVPASAFFANPPAGLRGYLGQNATSVPSL